jgi:hypothetical protein
MNSQLSFAVSQIQQQELRRVAREARLVSQPKTRAQFAVLRRFRVKAGTRRTAPAITPQPGTV